MEATFLKVINAEQTAQAEAMAAELKALSAKLAAFRAAHGDNHGLVNEAASYTKMAADNLEELVQRAQPSTRRFAQAGGYVYGSDLSAAERRKADRDENRARNGRTR